jgi:hypothetical protein
MLIFDLYGWKCLFIDIWTSEEMVILWQDSMSLNYSISNRGTKLTLILNDINNLWHWISKSMILQYLLNIYLLHTIIVITWLKIGTDVGLLGMRSACVCGRNCLAWNIAQHTFLYGKLNLIFHIVYLKLVLLTLSSLVGFLSCWHFHSIIQVLVHLVVVLHFTLLVNSFDRWTHKISGRDGKGPWREESWFSLHWFHLWTVYNLGFRPCHSSSGQLLASHQGDPGLYPCRMWVLWWTKWHWGRISQSISVSSRGWHNRSISGRIAKWTQLDSSLRYTTS